MSIRFFKTQADFRKWLVRNHDKVSELWLGFHKKASGLPSVTYKQALDEALCFGWIDGVRKSLNETSYMQRFTPRQTRSTWSRINIKRVEELKKLGLMSPSGLKAFAARDPKRTDLYSFENAPRTLSAGYERKFRQNKQAWQFFESLPPYFKKLMVFWITSARRDETRLKRLQTLIDSSAKGERLGLVSSKGK